MANSCGYYTEKMLTWMLNNKIIVLLSLLSFSLFVSTWALAAQKNKALSRIDVLNAQLATTTLAPTPNPEQPGTGETDSVTEGNGENGGNGGTEDNGGTDTGTGGNGGDSGTDPENPKSNAVIKENAVADQEETDDIFESGIVDSNYHIENVENESRLQSIVQNSKLLAALAA